MSLFWKIVDTLEPESTQAQIVVGLPRRNSKGSPGRALGELSARDLLRYLQADEEGEAVLVISTDRENCQEMVVRLSSLGVHHLHAVHPK